MSVDLVTLNKGEQGVMVSTTKTPEGGMAVFAMGVESKSMEHLLDGIFQAITHHEFLYGAGVTKRVHSDDEPGVVASTADLARGFIHVTGTGGNNPASNGNAERSVGLVTSLARSVLFHQECEEGKRALWPYACRWASIKLTTQAAPETHRMRVTDAEVLPFVHTVLVTVSFSEVWFGGL